MIVKIESESGWTDGCGDILLVLICASVVGSNQWPWVLIGSVAVGCELLSQVPSRIVVQNNCQ